MRSQKSSKHPVKPTIFKQLVYIKTFGCSVNQSDSEVMSGLLSEAGFDVISEYSGDDVNGCARIIAHLRSLCAGSLPSDAIESAAFPNGATPRNALHHIFYRNSQIGTDNDSDTANVNSNPKNRDDNSYSKKIDAVIINTCTVKNLAESKFFRELRKWQDKRIANKNFAIIVTGCIPQAEESLLNTKLKDVTVIGTRQIGHIVRAVRNTLEGKIVHNISNDYNERLNLPKIRKNNVIEIIPISEGCLSYCTYCKTRFARGQLLSYPKEKIIAQFRSALEDGCKEFWITSQDNGCYGFDIYRKEKYFLPQLLDDLLAIDGDFRIRLGMANPDHIDRIKDDLIHIFKHPKMYKFLHIPVQSGSNKVLRLMKRQYTIEDFKNIIKSFRKEIPGITISTDIIVGFPEETEDDFECSMKLLKDIRFDVLNFSRFWSRHGTEAEKMRQIDGHKIKERGIKLKTLFDKLISDKNSEWVGKTCMALVDEVDRNGVMIAHNEYYKSILIKNPIKNSIKNPPKPKINTLGNFSKFKIIGVTKYRLVGELINSDSLDTSKKS